MIYIFGKCLTIDTMSDDHIKWYADNPFNRYLKSEFELKKRNNSHYSIRAFAAFLGVDQSFLTKVLNGEKTFSRQLKEVCLRKLKADEKLISELARDSERPSFEKIDDELFELISDWKYFAIMQTLSLKNVSPTEEGISVKLGLSGGEVRKILTRLEELALVSRDGDTFVSLKPYLTWANNLGTSVSRRAFQKKVLEKSIHALETVPFERRDHGSVTFTLNKELMPKFKEILGRFRRELMEVLQQSGEPDEVYQLAVSLFPLSVFDSSGASASGAKS